MLSKLLATAAQGSSGAKSSRSGDFAMVSEGYDSLDGPWNLSNAVQVSELKNLIWTRVKKNTNPKPKPDYPEKALNIAVMSAWAYVAGMLRNNPTRLKRHFNLRNSTGKDPLN